MAAPQLQSLQPITRKSGELKNPTQLRAQRELPVSQLGSVTAPPIAYTLDNTGAGATTSFFIGWSKSILYKLSALALVGPTKISYQNMDSLAQMVGDGTLVINAWQYRVSASVNQYNEAFTYYENTFNQLLPTDLGPTISLMLSPTDYNNKILPVNLGDKRLVLNKNTGFVVDVQDDEIVTVIHAYSGSEGMTTGVFI